MTKFKTFLQERESGIPTSALPDIIFMLLFFFMVTTIFRKNDAVIKYAVPDANQIKKIENKILVTTINIGIPKNRSLGTEPVIESGGNVLGIRDIIPLVLYERNKLPVYYQDQQIILLKADENVNMGLIYDVQQELRKANARKIVYAANWKKNTIH